MLRICIGALGLASALRDTPVAMDVDSDGSIDDVTVSALQTQDLLKKLTSLENRLSALETSEQGKTSTADGKKIPCDCEAAREDLGGEKKAKITKVDKGCKQTPGGEDAKYKVACKNSDHVDKEIGTTHNDFDTEGCEAVEC